MPLDRSLAEVLGLHADVVRNSIRKCLPATVSAVHYDVDPETNAPRQTVDVQVGINNPIHDELGNPYLEPAPSICGVPVAIVRGGGFMVSVPVAIGDTVLLIFSDLSCDTWRASDGSFPVDPGWVGKHTHDSPFALPMVAPDKLAFSDLSRDPNAAGKLVIGKDGSAAQIRISATDVELGNNATDAVALASLVNAELQKIATAFSSFSPGSGGASFAHPYTTASDVKSSLVKAQ